MKLHNIVEAKKPAVKAAKIWLKISDLMVDLEDELLDMPNNPSAQKAIQQLRNVNFSGLNQEIKRMFMQ